MRWFYLALGAKVVVLMALIVWGPPWTAASFFLGAFLSLRWEIHKYYMLTVGQPTDSTVPPDDQGDWGNGHAG